MSTERGSIDPRQIVGFDFDKSVEDHDVYYILRTLTPDTIKDPRKWSQWMERLSPREYQLLQRLMIIDCNGEISIDKINEETLFEANNVGIFDSFSFWAWRKVIVWKLREEKTSLRVLKHVAAEGAFLGITATGAVETVGRSLASKIIKLPYAIKTRGEIAERPASGCRLSAMATAGAMTGLVTNFFPAEQEIQASTAIARGTMKVLSKFRNTLIGWIFYV